MQISFLELKKQNKPFEDELHKVLQDFFEKGHYILGENVKNFESEFAAFCSAKYCIGVANGLDALELILTSFNFPKGAEVIVPANTYYASILSILNSGLTPVLVEPDMNSYLIDAKLAEKAITDKTAAFLAVNLYGKMCNFDDLKKIADQYNLKLIVDAAQSHGAEYNHSRDCLGADAIAYSFYPTKNLGALADAGAVVTNYLDIAEKIKATRNYGSSIKYQFEFKGKNSRLSELQAGFLSVKLKKLSLEINRRRSIAARYLNEINNPKIILPLSDTCQQDAWHLFVIRTSNRDELKQYLLSREIGCDIHYPVPPHKQSALQEMNDLVFPITDEIHRTILSIPLNGSLLDEEVSYIIETLNCF